MELEKKKKRKKKYHLKIYFCCSNVKTVSNSQEVAAIHTILLHFEYWNTYNVQLMFCMQGYCDEGLWRIFSSFKNGILLIFSHDQCDIAKWKKKTLVGTRQCIEYIGLRNHIHLWIRFDGGDERGTFIHFIPLSHKI